VHEAVRLVPLERLRGVCARGLREIDLLGVSGAGLRAPSGRWGLARRRARAARALGRDQLEVGVVVAERVPAVAEVGARDALARLGVITPERGLGAARPPRDSLSLSVREGRRRCDRAPADGSLGVFSIMKASKRSARHRRGRFGS